MHLKNKFKVAITLFFTTLSFFGYSQSTVFKVALDAGHGGKDFGATYDGHVEKNITLAIVLKVGKILEETPKIDVIYTRKTDIFTDLIEKANIANRADANIFVSIHCNANKNRAADGTETYVMGMTKVKSNLEAAMKENAVITLEKDYKQKYEGFDPRSPETMIGITMMQEEYLENSISLASKVEDAFLALGKKIRGGGVKQAPYMVLHKAYMPRILIETGFISNSIEGAILDSEEGQNDIARAIASAIISYKKEYYGNGESEVNEVKPSQKINDNPVIVPKDTPPPAIKPSPVDSPAQPNKQTIKKDTIGIIYKVQLSASIKKVALEPRNFKGLKNISMSYDNKVYKYMAGGTKDYILALKNLQEAKKKGYDSAFLIAFRHGQKISMEEAQK
jgi:N-acetylmuramoyl-L-alanine amidase